MADLAEEVADIKLRDKLTALDPGFRSCAAR
jgi:hypothetical protein